MGSHLIEVLLQTAGNDLYNVLSSQCFKNIIVSLCMHPVANFLAQTFLRLLKDTERVRILTFIISISDVNTCKLFHKSVQWNPS